MSERAAFLAGERPDDVFMYFHEGSLSDIDALAGHGQRVDDGIVLVVEGDSGRSAFERATGIDPMAFAKRAMSTDGEVDPDCTGGTCPEDDEDGTDGHRAKFVFAFAQAQNEDVDGIYQEGDVIHAYVSCTCGAAYSQKWLAGER